MYPLTKQAARDIHTPSKTERYTNGDRERRTKSKAKRYTKQIQTKSKAEEDSYK